MIAICEKCKKKDGVVKYAGIKELWLCGSCLGRMEHSKQYQKDRSLLLDVQIQKLAQYASRAAIKKGIIRICGCEICGQSNVVAHHDDYGDPLGVRWLCRKHHKDWHRTNKPVFNREELAEIFEEYKRERAKISSRRRLKELFKKLRQPCIVCGRKMLVRLWANNEWVCEECHPRLEEFRKQIKLTDFRGFIVAKSKGLIFKKQ
jgi:hypothetical protein